MNSRDDWMLVEPLFDKALDLDQQQRKALVQEVSQQSRSLARKLRQLLDAAEGADSVLIDRTVEDVASEIVMRLPTERTSGLDVGALVGPYRIVAKLGEGGSGQVYAAYGQDCSKKMALKVLLARESEPEFVARFQREQQILLSLDHPNVVSVSDSGVCQRGFRYFAMDLVEGLPICDHCDRYELEFGHRAALLVQVCSAVRAAHGSGVIHRDLKPSNILVEGDADEGRAFVLDFGIARDQQPLDLTMSGQIIGTPGYMSPEQARGDSRRVDERCDIFSLGVLCYEVFAGVSPFRRNSAVETLAAVIREDPRPLGEICPDLGSDLAVVIHRCLRKKTEERLGSVSELQEALNRLA